MLRRALYAAALLICAATAMAQTGPLPPVNPQARRDYVAVLMWHDVVLETKEVWFDTTVGELKAQLASIKSHGCSVISLDRLYSHLTTGAPIPRRSVVLTFDDNNRGLYENAFPLLKQYGYPATLFVHTNYIGVTTSKPHCDWRMLMEMQRSGLVTIQGHSCSHPADMRLQAPAEADKELIDSKALIEKHTGRPVIAFAYTEGHFDEPLARRVWRDGYKLAFTEDWGNACASRNLMMVHRYSIHKRFAQAIADVCGHSG
ncbi:MAG TPA: polysaccharide deacetylase family protein [Chthonomonadaceae bacterium]|nr:polysaccharide deacetylase family protein [Chthonomonadaceae bacterium]